MNVRQAFRAYFAARAASMPTNREAAQVLEAHYGNVRFDNIMATYYRADGARMVAMVDSDVKYTELLNYAATL